MIEIYLHAANALILCSFLVRDIFWLRVISIIASFLFCTYFLMQDPKMVTATIWNLVFVAINVVQLFIEWRGRRKIPLSIEGSFIHESVFKGLDARDIQALVNLSNKYEVEKGHSLFNADENLDSLTLIVSGEAKKGNQAVIAPGTLIGVRGFLTQKSESMDAEATQKTICLRWPHHQVREWAKVKSERHSELMQKMSLSLAKELDKSAHLVS